MRLALRQNRFRFLRSFSSTPAPENKNVLPDFEFDPKFFSKNIKKLAYQEKFPSLEEVQKSNEEVTDKFKAKSQFEADPYSLVQDDMKLITDIIFNKIISTKYDKLNEVAEYNLKLKGKNFRSMIIMLLSRALYSKRLDSAQVNGGHQVTKFEDTDIYYHSALLAACVEICHNATLLQDDIIDKAETRRSQVAAYKVYGRSNSIFASNFLLSRASHMLASLETPYLSQLFSTMIYNLVFGELIQAKNEQESEDSALESYIAKTYYKTASLMSLACRAVSVIHDLDSASGSTNCDLVKQRKGFDFGAHFGIAFQVADDILDFTQSSEELGKPANNDLRSGLVTAPTLFASFESQDEELKQMIKRKFTEEGDIEKTLRIIDQTTGIDTSQRLALMHVEDSISALESLDEVDTDCDAYKALVKLTLKVKTRKY